MLQIRNLTITLRRDLRVIIEDFNFVLKPGDRAVIVGEEGNGKSTLLKAVFDAGDVAGYADISGDVLFTGAKMGFLRQELGKELEKSVASYFGDILEQQQPWELAALARDLSLSEDFFYSEQIAGTLSGGERVKMQLARLMLDAPDIYLLDEPSNDIDMDALVWLERFINKSKVPVLFISHDETLVENTANVIIHMELVRRKTTPRVTVARLGYREYVENRRAALAKQTSLARKEKEEHDAKMERFRRIRSRVDHDQAGISRQDPGGGRLLKKKMHAVKSMGRRFEREAADMTQLPDVEDAIFMDFPPCDLPNGKSVLDFRLDKLCRGSRLLAGDISLRITGAQKVCIIGPNGAGKSSLLKLIADDLLGRRDLRTGYMPQNYEDLLDMETTPIRFLAPSGTKADVTRAMTCLGSVKYTTDEMGRAVGDLSGGQKGKLLLLKMILHGCDVLILDEPTRNFSPLSNPVLRGVLKAFGGAVISVSHDRKYISEVCDTVYALTPAGLIASK